MTLKRSQYPKQFKVGEEYYTLRFVRKFKEKDTLAECDPGDREIRVLVGQSRQDILKCVIHELLHAFEFEHGIKIKHKLVYSLEKPLFEFIIDNFT